jgi:agmatine deiminase
MTKEEIGKVLCDYLNCEKVLWIPRGIYNDETNGHVDNMCNFVRPGVVVLAWTEDKNDPQYERSVEAYEYLSSVTDAKGRKLEIHKLLTPSPILITKEESEGVDAVDGTLPRQEGDRMAASYVNYYTGNGFVALPVFGDKNDENAIKVLGELYPDRKIEPIYAREILLGGGNIHCITQQVPKGNEK